MLLLLPSRQELLGRSHGLIRVRHRAATTLHSPRIDTRPFAI